MSTYYYFYAEVKTKGKWIGLSPIIKTADGKYKVQEIMWGQSAFHDFYDDLCDERSARCGLPEDISSDLQEVFHPHDEKTVSFWGNREITWGDYYKSCVHSVNYVEAIKNKIKHDRPYKYQGYVYKHLIASFEVGDEDDIRYWLTKQEYDDLPKDEKKDYAWYEWNEWGGEYGIRYELYQKVEALLDWNRDAAYDSKNEYDYDDFIASNVRLIVYRC